MTYTWEDESNCRDLTFEVEFYVSKYYPAQTSGPVEDCYPAEGGEIEITSVLLTDANFYDEDNDLVIRTFDDLTKEEVVNLEKEIQEELDGFGHLFDDVVAACEKDIYS